MRKFVWLVYAFALGGCMPDADLAGFRDANVELDSGDVDGQVDLSVDQAQIDAVDQAQVDADVDQAQVDSDVDQALVPDAQEPEPDMVLDGPLGCTPGTEEACGEDEGACEPGTHFCREDGTWSDCLGAVLPQEEECNGLDDDCDGEVDEITRECGSDVGRCERGVQRCVNAGWGACEDEVLPVLEICNGVDDDCDGVVDNTLARPCGSSVGMCEQGVEICVEGEWVCDAEYLPGDHAEDCEAAGDEDCDGQANEGCECVGDVQRPCGSGIGACETGLQHCAGGAWADECVGGLGPVDEICDGLDNDCDGATDNFPQIGQGCATGVGACRSEGTLQCGGEPEPVCNAVPGVPSAEICNGIDDDCDHLTDEDTPVVDSYHQISGPTTGADLVDVAVRRQSTGVISLVRPEGGADDELWFTLVDADGATEHTVLEGDGQTAVALVSADEIACRGPAQKAAGDGNNDNAVACVGGYLDGFVYAQGSEHSYLGVQRLDTSGATIGEPTQIPVESVPLAVDISWTGEGLGVVWVERVDETRAGTLWFAYLGRGQFGADVEPMRLSFDQDDRFSRPSIAWNGENFGVTFTRTAEAQLAEFLLITAEGEHGLPSPLSGDPASDVSVTGDVSNHTWSVVWRQVRAQREQPRPSQGIDPVPEPVVEQVIRAAQIDGEGQLWGNAINVATGALLGSLDLTSRLDGHGEISELGVAWYENGAVRFRRLLPHREELRVADGVHTINHGGTTAIWPRLSANSTGYSAVWLVDGGEAAGTWLGVGPFGCAGAPRIDDVAVDDELEQR